MGLDMNIYKRTHVGGYGGKKVKIIAESEDGEQVEIEQGRYGMTLEKDVLYLRKANQIHNWFVEEKGDGIDECQNIYLDIDDIKTLLNLCKDVKAKAKLGRGLIAGGTMGSGRENHKVVLVKPDSDDISKITKFEIEETIDSDKLKDGDWFLDTETSNPPFFYDDKQAYCRKTSDSFCQIYTFGETITNSQEIAEMLPTQEGFFFGSTDYDEYYLQDIDCAIEQLENIVKDYEKDIADGYGPYDIDYVYRASW